MKHIKTYEDIKPYYEGYYGLFRYNENEKFTYQFKLTPELRQFINNNIGFLMIVSNPQNRWISVRYDDIPVNLIHNFHQDGTILLDKENLITTTKTKEELEIKLQANKYNL